jgi:hypothetical protein
MKAHVLLADAAVASPDGKVHTLGLGWSITGTPTPPAALVLLIKVPWDQTNRKHKAKIELVDADGRLVNLGVGPDGSRQAFSVEGEFEAGRPAGLPPGTDVDAQLAIGLAPGMPLLPGQTYEYRLEIDGHHEETWSATFVVRPN